MREVGSASRKKADSYGAIDDYAKDGEPGADLPLCSFYHEPLRT